MYKECEKKRENIWVPYIPAKILLWYGYHSQIQDRSGTRVFHLIFEIIGQGEEEWRWIGSRCIRSPDSFWVNSETHATACKSNFLQFQLLRIWRPLRTLMHQRPDRSLPQRLLPRIFAHRDFSVQRLIIEEKTPWEANGRNSRILQKEEIFLLQR